MVGVGVLIFIGFTQILETPFHLFMRGNPAIAPILENPFVFALYGGLTAGIFEELGRFVAFFFLLKNINIKMASLTESVTAELNPF